MEVNSLLSRVHRELSLNSCSLQLECQSRCFLRAAGASRRDRISRLRLLPFFISRGGSLPSVSVCNGALWVQAFAW